MFNSKQLQLTKKTSDHKSSFIIAGRKKSAAILSEEGSIKLSTTNNSFVDQFASASKYRAPRSFEEISKDMQLLWNQNKFLTVCFTIYIRMITRVIVLFNGEKTRESQRGQGLKHEGIMRLIWLAVYHPEYFYKNIPLFISIGSWKDIIQMLSYDLQYHGWDNRQLDWKRIGQVILAGLENPNSSELVKKYLPQIKSLSKCTTLESQADTMIGKWICSLLFGNKTNEYITYKHYRKLKSSGTAHQWQQLISKGKFLDINFNSIHGKALAQLVSSKFLENQGLEEKYSEWIINQPVAKYTGYVYELLSTIKTGYVNNDLKPYQEETINKQFMKLVADSKITSNFIVVLDTSSSMTAIVPGTKVSAYSVGKSLALFFSYFLSGKFSNSWMEFNSKVTLHNWIGETPVQKLQNDFSESYGSTDFLRVADFFGELLKEGIPETDFPTGILCLSDGEFSRYGNIPQKSSFESFLLILKEYGFSEEFVNNFKVVLWDIRNNFYGTSQNKFEEFADCPNLLHIGGLDGSIISFLMNGNINKSTPKTSEELFKAVMGQEIFSYVQG